MLWSLFQPTSFQWERSRHFSVSGFQWSKIGWNVFFQPKRRGLFVKRTIQNWESYGRWKSGNRRFTRQADRRLPPGCYGNLIVNVKRDQSRPKCARGVDPDRPRIGPRSRSRLPPRYVLVVMKWRKNRSVFKAGPPLDLSFWSFWTFLHHGIEEVEASSVKIL